MADAERNAIIFSINGATSDVYGYGKLFISSTIHTDDSVQTNVGSSSGGSIHHYLYNNNSLRAGIGLQGTESSGNIGADFNIWQYGDDGSYLRRAMLIERASGDMTLAGRLNTYGVSSLPSGWGGGVNTFDVVAHGSLGIMNDSSGQLMATILNNGTANMINMTTNAGGGGAPHYMMATNNNREAIQAQTT